MTYRLFERRFTVAHPSYTDREVIKIIIIRIRDIDALRKKKHWLSIYLEIETTLNTQSFKSFPPCIYLELATHAKYYF